MKHEIETGWGDDYEGLHQIKAYCRRCQTWFAAFCQSTTDYVSIRSAEQRAAEPFADFACFVA